MSDNEQPKDKEQVNLNLKDEQGHSIFFKVKKKTKMAKVFANYHAQRGARDGTYIFTFDGTRLNEDDTVGQCELEDEDMILAVLGQTGGSGRQL